MVVNFLSAKTLILYLLVNLIHYLHIFSNAVKRQVSGIYFLATMAIHMLLQLLKSRQTSEKMTHKPDYPTDNALYSKSSYFCKCNDSRITDYINFSSSSAKLRAIVTGILNVSQLNTIKIPPVAGKRPPKLAQDSHRWKMR